MHPESTPESTPVSGKVEGVPGDQDKTEGKSRKREDADRVEEGEDIRQELTFESVYLPLSFQALQR